MSDQDKFVAMVSAKAEVNLPLGEFQPKSTLVQEEHHLQRARLQARARASSGRLG